jgi:hypothetical protein
LSLLNKRLKVKKSHHQSGTNDGERSVSSKPWEVHVINSQSEIT